MVIRVVGIRRDVDFPTKDRRTGEEIRIKGCTVYYVREKRGVDGYESNKCFISEGTKNPFTELNRNYEVHFNEYGRIDFDDVTLA